MLSGSNEQRIRQHHHDELSTWGILSAHPRRSIREWIEQLVSQRVLEKTGEYNVLQVTDSGRSLLRGDVIPRLVDVNQTPASPDGSGQTQDVSDVSMSALGAFEYFRQGWSVSRVAKQMNRALSTTCGYLDQFIHHERVTDPSPWVEEKTVRRVAEAVATVGAERLKPIYDALGGDVSYEEIRIVAGCLRSQE